MSKFQEGEIVRSTRKIDEDEPFFIVDSRNRTDPLGDRGCWLRCVKDNQLTIRKESALRHTEKDSKEDL